MAAAAPHAAHARCNFFCRLVYRVKYQEWISNHGQDADVGFVCNVSGEWKFLKKFRQILDPLHNGGSRKSVAFENVGKNVFDFGERRLGPANLHARTR